MHFSFDVPFLFQTIGNVSFVLSACAYLMRDLLKLRTIAICSGLCGLIYNATLPSGPLYLVLFWLSVFLCINLWRIASEVRNRMEAPLGSEQRALLVETFPTMHSRDWLLLVQAATVSRHTKGERLLSIGDHTAALSILARGEADEIRQSGEVRPRTPSAMWGELSFVTHRQFDGSPCSIVVTSDTAEVYQWPYEALQHLCDTHARLRAALMEGFVLTAGLKHGLLSFDAQANATGGAKAYSLQSHRAAAKAVAG